MRRELISFFAALVLGIATVHAEDQQPPGIKFEPTISSNKTTAPGSPPRGMVWIPGGEFSMGAKADGGGNRPGNSSLLVVHAISRVSLFVGNVLSGAHAVALDLGPIPSR
jgi:formylglycine-generating enzyme required for sulfatase activity